MMGKKAERRLSRLKMIDAMVANKQAERERWIEMASGTTSQVGGDRVQSSGDHDKIGSKVIEAVTIDEEIQALKAEKKAIIKLIEMLEPDEYDLLHKVYVQGMTLKEVQVSHGMSYSWATTLHRRAKDSLERLL